MPWLNRTDNLKRNDFYLAGAMCFIALVLYLINIYFTDKGQVLIAYKDNEVIGEYSLYDEGSYTIESDDGILMKFEIKNREVDVLSANCKDKLCVHQKAVKAAGEVICCLPNKILLKVLGDDKEDSVEDYDAVTR